MVVELVIGKAPAPWATFTSTCTTASAPSHVVGMPGYSNFCSTDSGSASGGRSFRVPVRIVSIVPWLIADLLGKALSSGAARSGTYPPLAVQADQRRL